MFWAIVISVAILSYAGVKIARIITNNWENEA
jgi:hypothetical protein